MKLNNIYIYLTFIVIITSCDTSETNANNESLNFPKPSIKEASLLAENPLQCIDQKYPFKTSVVYNSEVDVLPPETVHPSFYGCFDWHSAVHGHWSLVRLIKLFPDLPEAKEIQEKLKKNISKENIKKEVTFFKSENNSTFERTYGWAWIFQLATELKTWEDELADELLSNMEPLINLLERQTIDFLPKLEHPIRVGEHSNTAFSLSLMFDYSKVFKKHDFEALIKERAISYYKDDQNCPIDWEPSGFDFLSPCLEEARLMAKVLDEPGFKAWIQAFLPELEDEDFYLPYAKVTDRKDGKLVHLDGLNFSRAWCLYELSNKLDKLSHLEAVADFHYIKTFPNLFGDSYEGAHWLGSFAIYTLSKSNKYRFRQ